jgi:hypothetical protein
MAFRVATLPIAITNASRNTSVVISVTELIVMVVFV